MNELDQELLKRLTRRTLFKQVGYGLGGIALSNLFLDQVALADTGQKDPMASRKPQRFNGTVPVHFFFGLQESIKMIEEETLEGVFARHARLAEATRACVRAWGADGKGPSLFGQTEDRLSNSVTTIMMR